jgi:hypothetical protein
LDISEHSEALLEQFHAARPAKPRRAHMTAIELEREECAKIAEAMGDSRIAEAIRARGQGLRRARNS